MLKNIKLQFLSLVEYFRTFSWKKFLNNLKTYFSKPQNIITIVFAIVLLVGVIFPLATMVLDSFKVQSLTEAKTMNDSWNLSLKKGDYTWALWPYVLFNPRRMDVSATLFWVPLYQSLLMALLACFIAVVIGGALAFFVTRTNLPFKKFISTVFVFPYIMPSWSIAMFWENFFKNTAVDLSLNQMGLLQSLTGIQVPSSMIYGLVPCAIVLGIHYAPFAYILMGGILRNMDANLEEAATILKTKRIRTLFRITLPIVAPALISTVLLVFSSSVSSYTVPAFLGGNFNAISVQMRSMLNSTESKGQGYVVAVILLIFSIIILTINNRFTSSRRSFTTVSGKSGQISKIELGRGKLSWIKWVVAVLLIIFVTFFAIVPLITFILESLESISGDISTITLKYWISNEDFDYRISNQGQSSKGIFHNSTIWSAFGRSVIVAVCVSLIAGTCGILIGYAASKKRHSKVAKFVSNCAFLPYLIPALSFGAIFFSLSYVPGFEWLNATRGEANAVIACIICGGIKFLPFASRSGTNAMLQLSGEIEEAAIIVNVPWWKRMSKILFPIQKSSFISCYLLPFISAMRELTLFTLLTGSFTLITNVLQYFDTYGLNQISNGINLLIVLFVIIVNLLVNKLTGASIDKGIGG
ncbi:MAG: iron ABC transporter permease [Candidatus Onthovivens sp.]|nr:iron ABC transporter permease [Candidatus Onthovivens sp.]MDY4936658.1 iron ABC transporter permease [Candidatus Onthovivens sp.]